MSSGPLRSNRPFSRHSTFYAGFWDKLNKVGEGVARWLDVEPALMRLLAMSPDEGGGEGGAAIETVEMRINSSDPTAFYAGGGPYNGGPIQWEYHVERVTKPTTGYIPSGQYEGVGDPFVAYNRSEIPLDGQISSGGLVYGDIPAGFTLFPIPDGAVKRIEQVRIVLPGLAEDVGSCTLPDGSCYLSVEFLCEADGGVFSLGERCPDKAGDSPEWWFDAVNMLNGQCEAVK